MSLMATAVNRSNALFRALAAIWLFSTIVLISAYRQNVLGYAAYGGKDVHVAAGTTPVALVLALVGLVFLSALTGTELRVDDCQIAPLWRRYIALAVDFWFFVFTYAALTAMIPLTLEARRTGKFQWAFERDNFVSSDGILDVLNTRHTPSATRAKHRITPRLSKRPER